MGDKSAIEWTEATWNPVRGCTRVSPGCGGPGKAGGCYAEKIAARFSDPGMPFHGFAERRNGEARWTGKLALVEEHLTDPLRWKRPRRIFVNSMSDLFHESLPDEAIDKVFAVMALCPQHTFQVLTKRPERMRAYLSPARAHPVGLAVLEQTFLSMAKNPRSEVGAGVKLQGDIAHLSVWPLPNVWLGVSAERQKEADERIPLLLETPAAIRFVSAEPLLGPIDLTHIEFVGRRGGVENWDALDLHLEYDDGSGRWEGECTSILDWVIVGGESGPSARPMHPDWARSLRDQCQAAGVPFFFKQWGAWGPDDGPLSDGSDPIADGQRRCAWRANGQWHFADDYTTAPFDSEGEWLFRTSKKAAGRLLDGREWNEFPALLELANR